MSVHLIKAISSLRSKAMRLASETESILSSALTALENRDMILAKKTIDADGLIDELEVEVEEDCLKILALYQPVASDLRFIVTVLKVTNDLERIGDLATNIASRALELADKSEFESAFDINEMGSKTKAMLSDAIAALSEGSVEQANAVMKADKEINELRTQHFGIVEKTLRQDIDSAQDCFRLLSISRYIERIADLAKNIAEDVVYLIDGKIVRHSNTPTTSEN